MSIKDDGITMEVNTHPARRPGAPAGEKLRTPAQQYYDAYFVVSTAEEALDDALLTALGINPDEPDSWPLGSTGYDWYDASFELYSVKLDWAPPADLSAVWALGFHHGYVNFTDGTEYIIVQNGGATERRQSHHRIQSDYKRELFSLRKELAALRLAGATAQPQMDVKMVREAFRHLEQYLKASVMNGMADDISPAAGHAYLLLRKALYESRTPVGTESADSPMSREALTIAPLEPTPALETVAGTSEERPPLLTASRDGGVGEDPAQASLLRSSGSNPDDSHQIIEQFLDAHYPHAHTYCQSRCLVLEYRDHLRMAMRKAVREEAAADRDRLIARVQWLVEQFKGYRDAPMTTGDKTEIATIRKTLNVVVEELAAALKAT